MYIIIRDCDLPLIYINDTLNNYLEKFFVSSSTDRTLYNIAISYVAAYIFYIIQVHIPFEINNQHGMQLIKNDVINNINDIKLLLLLISELTVQTESNGKYLSVKNSSKSFYIIEHSKKQILKITFLETYHKLKERIIMQNEQILSHHAISYLDLYIVELLSALPIDEIFSISDNIYFQKCTQGNARIITNSSIKRANFIISQLEQRYDFIFESYSITTDINQKSIYETLNLRICQYSENELERKVKITF